MKLLRKSQWEEYPEEMSLLSQNEAIAKKSRLYQLQPILDQEGVMRMRSRLINAEEESLQMPIILAPKNPLTRLLIHHIHQVTNHGHAELVLNELRQRYWIPTGKTVIKGILRKCLICKIRKAKAYPPQMSALPSIRVSQQQRPFTIVAVDYFGPMEVTVKRSHEKRYGVLFSCLTTRAIHLEIAYSLNTDSCIMAIRRMIAIRGQPKQLHSDNGTNLRGADRELKQSLAEFNQSRLKDELEVKGIKWTFVSPRSPHMAGAVERMVRSVKNALSTTLKSRAPKDEILQTLFSEAEAVVNSRPLTTVPTDPESPEALTPFHFLIGSSSPLQPPGDFDDREADLGKNWRKSQALTNIFWKRWKREYLPTLQRRTKWHDEIPNVEIGDVVILFDESLRTRSWPLGVIVGVCPGGDGIVRVVNVKTSTGIYQRPVVKLGILGIKSQGYQEESTGI